MDMGVRRSKPEERLIKTMPKQRKNLQQLAESGTLVRNSGRYAGRAAAATAPFKSLGKPPGHLPPTESAVWRELSKAAPAGHLQNSDRFFVELCCRLIVRMRTGCFKPSENNSLANILSKLALNPVDRAKLNLLPTASPTRKSEQDKLWDSLD
jgi:phage terminase small subunit